MDPKFFTDSKPHLKIIADAFQDVADGKIKKLAVSLQVTSLSDSVATSSFTIFFAPIHNRYTLVDKIDKSKPALTFHAFMQRDPLHLPAKEAAIEEIAKHGFEKIFLCNSADHRQLPDPSQEELILSKLGARCKEYKEMAEAIGCSLSNPSLLFINHAFLSCIK